MVLCPFRGRCSTPTTQRPISKSRSRAMLSWFSSPSSASYKCSFWPASKSDSFEVAAQMPFQIHYPQSSQRFQSEERRCHRQGGHGSSLTPTFCERGSRANMAQTCKLAAVSADLNRDVLIFRFPGTFHTGIPPLSWLATLRQATACLAPGQSFHRGTPIPSSHVGLAATPPSKWCSLAFQRYEPTEASLLSSSCSSARQPEKQTTACIHLQRGMSSRFATRPPIYSPHVEGTINRMGLHLDILRCLHADVCV